MREGMIVRSKKNPVIPNMGVCDPHLHQFKDRIYLFCSHDTSVENKTYHMEDWQIWSTGDFIEWRLEQIVKPEDFFMGQSDCCWAVDAAEKDNRYYLYYSNKNVQVGVATADFPGGPYKDAKESPILDGTVTEGPEYDPAIFTDEDGSRYIVFGGPKWAYGDGAGYYIVRLSEDMLQLAEAPRKLQLDHEADDKVSLNKIGGTYYLTWGSFYAISDTVYGPYKYIGNIGVSEDHGSYLEYHGQIFHAFTIFDPTMVHRASGICYIHQTADKRLMADELIVEYGVGHYDAQWNKIQSQWYMKGTGIKKIQNSRYGFDILTTSEGSVWYPNIEHIENKKCISFFASSSCPQGGEIEVHEMEHGEIIGGCDVKYTGSSWRSYRMFTCSLSFEKEVQGLYLTLRVKGQGELRLDYFKFYEEGQNL